MADPKEAEFVVAIENGKTPFSWRRTAICLAAWVTVVVMVLVFARDGRIDPEETILISNALVVAAGLSGYAVNLLGKK